jgi:hypothetical protein
MAVLCRAVDISDGIAVIMMTDRKHGPSIKIGAHNEIIAHYKYGVFRTC